MNCAAGNGQRHADKEHRWGCTRGPCPVSREAGRGQIHLVHATWACEGAVNTSGEHAEQQGSEADCAHLHSTKTSFKLSERKVQDRLLRARRKTLTRGRDGAISAFLLNPPHAYEVNDVHSTWAKTVPILRKAQTEHRPVF